MPWAGMFYSWLWFCVRKFDLKGKILAFCLPHKECSYLSLFLVRFSFLLLSQDFLGSPLVETLCFHCSGAQVWSLVRELGSHMPHSVDQKLKTKKYPWACLSVKSNINIFYLQIVSLPSCVCVCVCVCVWVCKIKTCKYGVCCWGY